MKQERDGKREEKMMGIKKEKCREKRRRIKMATKTEGEEGLREEKRDGGQYKAYNSQRAAVGRTGVIWAPSTPLHSKDIIEAPLCCPPWTELDVGVRGIVVRV